MSKSNANLLDRMRVELVEADVEQAFGLVDLAEEATLRGRPDEAARMLVDADRVLEEIDQRIIKLPPGRAWAFGELVKELRRSVEKARSHLQ